VILTQPWETSGLLDQTSGPKTNERREEQPPWLESASSSESNRLQVSGLTHGAQHGCPKSTSGQGCSSFHSLETHLDSHGSKSIIRNDRYRCAIEDCYRAQPGKGSGTLDAAKYHADTHAKKNTDSFLCSDPGCGRSESGKGFGTLHHLERHMDSHERGVAISESLKRCAQTSCSDPRYGHITAAFFCVKHEEQHVDGRFACRACGLRYYHAAYANEHALHECRVEDAVTIHIPPPMKVVCTEPRCGHWRENTDLGNADMKKHIEARYVKGKGQ
jgi:hypothetical protein